MSTHVGQDAICASACVMPYASASLRTAHESAQFGFHAASGGEQELHEERDRSLYIQYIGRTSPELIEALEIMGALEHFEVTWLSASETYNLVN